MLRVIAVRQPVRAGEYFMDGGTLKVLEKDSLTIIDGVYVLKRKR